MQLGSGNLKHDRSSCGTTKPPSQIATPPTSTDSDEDGEPASVSNNGSVTSPRLWPHSPWTTDESSDSEAHLDSTELSWLTSIKEKATIQYPITPESSLVCAKEEPPHLDSNVTGPDGLPKDIVGQTVSCLIPTSQSQPSRKFGFNHSMPQPTTTFTFAFTYGILSHMVPPTLVYSQLAPFYCSYDLLCFDYILGYLNLSSESSPQFLQRPRESWVRSHPTFSLRGNGRINNLFRYHLLAGGQKWQVEAVYAWTSFVTSERVLAASPPTYSDTGGEGTWKWVRTSQEHWREWHNLPGTFLSGTFHAHSKCNSTMHPTFSH